MDKADLAALLDAHGGRAQPVASLHVLRASSLGDDEQAFLAEHHAELATVDLSRWLGLAAPEQRPAVIEALAWLAEREPSRFELEIARAPHFELAAGERARLIERLHGRVPETVLAALSGEATALPAGGPGPAAPTLPDGGMFDPGDLLGDMDFSDGGGDPFGAGEPAGLDGASGSGGAGLGDGGLGDLLGDVDLFGGDGEVAASGDGGGFFGGAPPPLLGEHLARLPGANTGRARTAWRAKAKALAADAAEDWSRAAPQLPPEMADAVAHRAATSPRAEERATLLEWLLQNEARKSTLVELSVALIGLEPKVEGVSQWLAQSFLPRVLSDKASWQKHGAAVLSALATRRALGELDQLFTSSVAGAGALGPGLLSLPAGGDGALRGPIFAVFSGVLLDRTSAALTAKEAKSAQAYAAALASLGFPSRSAKAVESLRRKRAAKGDVARMLALAPSRGPKHAPKLEDFVAAVHVLSDAL